MGAGNHYALAALPALEPPPAAPPIPLPGFLERVPPGRARELAAAVLLSDDLHQRQACLAGELGTPEPSVLTRGQLRGEEPLPAFLGIDAPAGGTVGDDGPVPAGEPWVAWALWAQALARSQGSPFLARWVATETGLRSLLAERRARALGVDPAPHLVQGLEGEVGPEEEAAVRAWSEAPDPLAGLRALLLARWRWLVRHQPWFTFEDDELAAYAAGLLLLHRWRRSGAGAPGAGP